MQTKRVLSAFFAGTLAAAAAAAQTSNFASSYNGASTAGGTCSMSYSIAGVEPSGTGPYPVFIYMVGTSETYNNAAAMATVNAMASKGYIAATVDYAASQFGSCSVLSAKSSCVFNPNSALSAVSQLCSRAKADCSKGIVVGGFSQGSILALLAKNFDARVQAAYGIGMSNVYATYDLSSCVSNGNRSLPSDRLRAVDGERDNFAGGVQSAVQSPLQNVTGLTHHRRIRLHERQQQRLDHREEQPGGRRFGRSLLYARVRRLFRQPKQPRRQLEQRHGELGEGHQPAMADQLHDEITA